MNKRDNTPPTGQLGERLIELQEQNRLSEAEMLLTKALSQAEGTGNKAQMLSILGEQAGFYRKCAMSEKGLSAVKKGLELISGENMESSISSATFMVNAATALQSFGDAQRAEELFERAGAVYEEKLPPGDYRLAALYNNMAFSCLDTGEADRAETLFKRALRELDREGGRENEKALTLCSLAQLYDSADSEDGRIEKCMEAAWENLNSPELKHDGYHCFAVEKCLDAFDYFGYFIWAGALRERVKCIRERN